jgi:ribosomal protein S18 acetylase RimI-like enzyme
MAHNAAAIALYRKLGFEIYGRAPRAMVIGARAYDELLMRFDL